MFFLVPFLSEPSPELYSPAHVASFMLMHGKALETFFPSVEIE